MYDWLVLVLVLLFIVTLCSVKNGQSEQQFYDESVQCQQLENECTPADSDFKDDSPPEEPEWPDPFGDADNTTT